MLEFAREDVEAITEIELGEGSRPPCAIAVRLRLCPAARLYAAVPSDAYRELILGGRRPFALSVDRRYGSCQTHLLFIRRKPSSWHGAVSSR